MRCLQVVVRHILAAGHLICYKLWKNSVFASNPDDPRQKRSEILSLDHIRLGFAPGIPTYLKLNSRHLFRSTDVGDGRKIRSFAPGSFFTSLT